jgi:nucleotide-binding universal stress UspA family protein
MEAINKSILVPWDFSNVAEYALQHAISAAKVINCGVTLCHITKKEKENDEAIDKMKTVVADTKHKFSIEPQYIVKEGSIFTSISEIAEEVDAVFVIMGTHGIKGMQKITGSWALKVVASCKVPFIIVQKPPHDEQLPVIAYPVDYKKEDKQKSIWAVYLNKYFKSKIYLFTQKSNDATLKKHIQSNVKFTKQMLESANIEYEVTEAEGLKDFDEEIIDFSVKINASTILITTTKNIELKDYMFGATEQNVIANKEGISVMCVNPKEGKIQGFN